MLKPIKRFSLILVTDPDRKKILLGRKKRGFGVGKWNGFGGKLDENESMDECAKRELFEECLIVADQLERFAIVSFESEQTNYISEVHYYITTRFFGQEKESDEMLPRWFPTDRLPLEFMFPDVPHWFPHFLHHCRFVAHFKSMHEQIVQHHIRELSDSERLVPFV